MHSVRRILIGIVIIGPWVISGLARSETTLVEKHSRAETVIVVGQLISPTERDTKKNTFAANDLLSLQSKGALWRYELTHTRKGETNRGHATLRNDGEVTFEGHPAIVFFERLEGIPLPCTTQKKFYVSREGGIVELGGEAETIQCRVIQTTYTPPVVYLKSTLSVGESWSSEGTVARRFISARPGIKLSDPAARFVQRVTVTGLESTSTPMGTLDALKVERRMRNLITHEWWAQGVGLVREILENSTTGFRRELRLVSVAPGEKSQFPKIEQPTRPQPRIEAGPSQGEKSLLHGDIVSMAREAGRLYDNREWLAAERTSAQVLAVDPENFEAHSNLGSIYLRLGDLEKGKLHNQKAMNLNPDDPKPYYNTARTYARMGDTEKAVILLRQAVLKGFKDLESIRRDPDLESIRGDPRFQSLINKH